MNTKKPESKEQVSVKLDEKTSQQRATFPSFAPEPPIMTPVDPQPLTPPVAPPPVDEKPPTPEPQTPVVEPPTVPAGKVAFTLKDAYRWNTIQSGGYEFVKGVLTVVSADDPVIAQFEANPWIEKANG